MDLVDGTSALSPIEMYKSITGSSIWLTRRKYKLNMVEIWLQSGYSLLRSVENSPAVLSPSAFEDACSGVFPNYWRAFRIKTCREFTITSASMATHTWVMDFIDGETLAGVLRQAGGKRPPSILAVKREIPRIKHEVQGSVYCGLVAWREIHCFRR